MELVTTVTLLGIAFLFVYIAFAISKTNKPLRFFFMFLTLLMVYLAVGALYSANLGEENRLNYTSEESMYWNCTLGINSCTGQVEPEACDAYTFTQCNQLEDAGENCTWGQGACEGTPTWTCEQIHAWGHANGYGHDKCEETAGCLHTVLFENSLCDEINVTYYYGNYSRPWDYSGGALGAYQIVQWVLMFLMFYFFMFFLIGLLEYMRDVVMGRGEVQYGEDASY